MKTKLVDQPLSDNVRDFARQIWLAGLGAFARAQQEGGRLFETLVQEGQAVDQRMRQNVQARSAQAQDEVDVVKGKVEVLRDQATGTWNKLEAVFQARVARALRRLGVPTQDDMQQLFRQVEQLNQNIREWAELTQAGEARTRKARVAKTTEPVAAAKAADTV